MNTKSLILALAILGLSGGFVLAYEGHDHDEATENQKIVAIDDTDSTKAVEVSNKICPVSGDKVSAPGEKGTMGDNPVKVAYKGKIYNLCCPMCVKDFKKNPEKYSAVAEKEVKEVK